MSFKVIEVNASVITGARYAAHVAGPGFCLLDEVDCRAGNRVLKFNESCPHDRKNMSQIIDQQSRKGYSARAVAMPEGFL